jgi:hypothetical protein
MSKNLNKEIRFLCKVKKFDKIKAKDYFHKVVWYFDKYKITKVNSHEGDRYYKTLSKFYGKPVKENEFIDKADALNALESWDRLYEFKMFIYAKLPKINDRKLYIEQIKLIPKRGKEVIFYSTEAETERQLKDKELLNEIPGVKVIKELGEVSLYDIAKEKLYK